MLIDFGSTYTQVVAVDLASAEVVGRSQSASTVQTDVREGLLDVLTQLHARHGLLIDQSPSTSLVRLHLGACFEQRRGWIAHGGDWFGSRPDRGGGEPGGAGGRAKLIGSWSFKLRDQVVVEIEAQRPDMILLYGLEPMAATRIRFCTMQGYRPAPRSRYPLS